MPRAEKGKVNRARSSAGEHTLHTGGVTGSIPVAPTSLSDLKITLLRLQGENVGTPRDRKKPRTYRWKPVETWKIRGVCSLYVLMTVALGVSGSIATSQT